MTFAYRALKYDAIKILTSFDEQSSRRVFTSLVLDDAIMRTKHCILDLHWLTCIDLLHALMNLERLSGTLSFRYRFLILR
jgi:hypothetical protein